MVLLHHFSDTKQNNKNSTKQTTISEATHVKQHQIARSAEQQLLLTAIAVQYASTSNQRLQHSNNYHN
jgi:hypothetical protein